MKLLVCGTQVKSGRKIDFTKYKKTVNEKLDKKLREFLLFSSKSEFEIVEGCCESSADEIAETWAEENKIKVIHHPATTGTYLKRNIDMVNECTEVVAFWDGWSYGTAHTISHAILQEKDVEVIEL